jgi:hypothetical protein
MTFAIYTLGLVLPAAGIVCWLFTDNATWLVLCIPVVLFLS